MLETICSGFQTGADIAGIKAAKASGLKTTGFIPKGFKTLAGPKPEYAKLYGAIEHPSSNYRDRTWDNIQAADATFRFATDWNSPGEKCTLNGIKNWNKPWVDFNITNRSVDFPGNISVYPWHWIGIHQIKVLNIAGNSEQTSPGIEKIVYEYLMWIFKMYKEDYK